MLGYRTDVVGIVAAKQHSGVWVAYRNRGWEREDAVGDVLLTATPKGRSASNVGDVVAAVVQSPEELAVPAQLVVTGAKASAGLEHRPCVLARQRTPILDAHRPPSQTPLRTFGNAESLHQLSQPAYAVGVLCHEARCS